MTVEAFTPSPVYLVAGTGPYAVTHPYRDGTLQLAVWRAGIRTELDPTEYTVSPPFAAEAGAVTLTTAAAEAHEGGRLFINRETVPEQGWAGTSSRERGLEAQLDWITQGVQDASARLGRALTAPLDETGSFELPPAAMRAGRLLMFSALTGAPIAADALDGSVLATPFMETVLAAADAPEARTLLGLEDVVDVTAYGATGDGTNDDTAAIQAAIDASDRVYFPAGTYVHTQLNLRSGLHLVGAGQGIATLSYKSGSNGFGVRGVDVTNVHIAGLTLDGNSAGNTTGGMGVRIEGASSHIRLDTCRVTGWRFDGIAIVGAATYVDVINCRVDANLRDGVSFTGAQHASVTNSRLLSNGRFGVVFGAGSHHARLAHNAIVGNAATDATGCGALAISLTDATFSGNVAASNGLGHGLQFNTVTRGTMTGNVSRDNGISGLDSFASQYVTFSGNVSFANAVRGIEIDSAAFYNAVVGNIVYRNGGAGISVFRSPATLIADNVSTENGAGLPPGLEFSPGVPLPPEPYGIRLWDPVNTLPSNNCRLIGNLATDDRGGSATQTHGISIEATNTSGVVVIGNVLAPNITAPLRADAASSIARARDNTGWTTQAEGSGSIASGTTSVVIAHGLALTPAAEAISISPTNSPTSDPGNMWISGITGAEFTVNCRANPGASGLNFRWRASVF